MRENTVKNRIIIFVLTIVTVLFMSMGVFGALFEKKPTAYAASYSFNSAADFVAYSKTYGVANQYDVISIDITAGYSDLDGFVSLGTSSAPFAGRLTISDPLSFFNCPLFDYVSTDMTLVGGLTLSRKAAKTGSYDGTSDGALFANHVVAGTNPASWSLILEEADSNQAETFKGVFGDIGANAEVDLTFTNRMPNGSALNTMNVSGSGDTGLIAGSIGTGATLGVTTTAYSGGNITVTSTGGEAGGLVGKMASGSTLNLKSANNSRISSVSASGSNKYAGGVVGHNDGGTINVSVASYDISALSVSGNKGAGGVCGYYVNYAASYDLNLNKYAFSSTTQISATASDSYAGGAFGAFINEGSASTVTVSGNVGVKLDSASRRGGIIGWYNTDDLTNTLKITNVVSDVWCNGNNTRAGLIGRIDDNSTAYVSISDVTCTARNTISAGLIGYVGTGGNFIDVSGNVTISGNLSGGGGLIDNLSSGVLRLAGVTDISGVSSVTGQIVRARDKSLIYALGNGKDYTPATIDPVTSQITTPASGWKLIRRSTSLDVDDIYGWGQVLRVDGTNLNESDLFTVNSTAHTVTVAAAATTINNVTDFAKTALNIQLNTGDVGALKFNGGSRSSTLLGGTITLNADIDLSGTGLTGFTRDDGSNAAFTGTFSGGENTITLATGEAFGVTPNSTQVTAENNFGGIHNHKYTGLFAKAGSATIGDLTLVGYVNVRAKGDSGNWYVGGVAAYVNGSLTLNNVSLPKPPAVDPSGSVYSGLSLNMISTGNSYTIYAGGAVGAVASGGSVTVSGGTYGVKFVDSTSVSGGTGVTVFGGVVGNLTGSDNSSVSQAVSIGSSAVLSSTYTKGSVNRTPYFGAAIGRIERAIYSSGTRMVDISGVTVSFNATATPVGGVIGGILGTEWYDTDVTIADLTVSGSTITATGTGIAVNMGGLVRVATGHWDVQSIAIAASGLTITVPSNASSTFGFVANRGFDSDGITALYLDVDNTGSNYNISALDISGTTFGVFDELVAYTKISGNIQDNGQAIVSVSTTDGNALTSSNVYHNKTTYGSGIVNPNARYYYNLKAIRAKATKSDADKLLLWSVNTYAHSSIKGFFPAFTVFNGDLNMTGYSYYPVTVVGQTLTFGNNSATTLAFDNTAIEGAEGRTTLTASSQHYLMQAGLLLSYAGTLNISDMTVKGNVPLLSLSGNESGFLVRGTLGGNESINTNVTINGLNLGTYAASVYSPAYVTNSGSQLTSATFAPLIINNIGINTNLTLSGVTQPGYGTSFSNYAASSLIGAVGSETATNITLVFSGIALDARKTSNTPNITAYGTLKSIFSRATLLESLQYSSDGSATYNFTKDDDWGGTPARRAVTYGEEISESQEFERYFKYYPVDNNDKPRRYVNYAGNNNEEEVSFTAFRPYVYVGYDVNDNHHEIAVNVAADGILTAGCGKKDDPYIITDGTQLEMISAIISGAGISRNYQINLPTSLVYSGSKASCADYVYHFNGTVFVSDGHADKALADVREYLAGAYYEIAADILLTTDFKGLGKPNESVENFICAYAFRGVIYGVDYTPVDGEGEPTGDPQRKPIVTNSSGNPLIHASNGSVVKDLTIEVSGNTLLNVPTSTVSTQTFLYSGGQDCYGGVIGRVMGGDNFIDAVTVTYSSLSFSYILTTNYQRLIPIGGYVGVIVNGGLVFKNMTDTAGMTNTVYNRIGDAGYLYVNPFIGRVLAGYAFNEGAAYHYTESATTLKNGSKNYSIPDLNPGLSKLQAASNSVTVPNGQALYVLSLIINSGAGSASSAGGDYANLSTTPWVSHREYTVARSAADVTAVPTNYTGRNKTPYIISSYVDGASTNARKLGNGSYTFNFASGVTCDLPEAFRGIGSMYYNDSKLRLGVSTLNGNSSTVNFNTKYYEYNFDRGEAYKFTDSAIADYIYYSETSVRALGLINQIYDNNCTVNNLILSGSVDYDLKNRSSGGAITYDFGSTGDNTIGKYDGVALNVGGLIGNVYNKTLSVNNVSFNDLSVKGAKWVGGLIGAAHNVSALNINNCSTQNNKTISVSAGHQAGGYIGRTRKCAVNVNNTSGSSSTLNVGTISVFGRIISNTTDVSGAPSDNGTNDSNNNGSYSVGGIIGYFRPDSRNLTVNNATISGGEIKLTNMANDGAAGFAGGVLGSTFSITSLTFNGIEISGVTITGEITGGLIGGIRISDTINITNCTLDGAVEGSDNATIEGKNKAGGIFGIARERTANVSSVVIKNYDIIQSYEANYITGAGGISGHLYGNTLNLKDVLVSDCSITSGYTSLNNANKGTGGLIGVTTNGGSVNGYNILLDGVFIKNASDRNYGVLLGKNGGSSVVKLVGVSFVDVTTKINEETVTIVAAANVTGQAISASGSYVIFADYMGSTTNDEFSIVGSGANVSEAVPYATINPTLELPGLTITGDGVSAQAATIEQNVYNGLALNEVIYDILRSGGGKYLYAATAANLSAINGSLNTFATFSELAGSYPGGANDFPVLTFEYNSGNPTAVQSFLQAYIRLLTNTTISFDSSTSDIYAVDIYRVSYDGVGFSVSNTDVSLNFANLRGFYLTENAFDSGKDQFSLIDIKFKNPINTSQIAYHLYIPVVVKKIIAFDFNVSAASGTNYLVSEYQSVDRYGKALMENTGTPVTLYFEYVYSHENSDEFRSKQNWIAALNGGESLMGNYGKYLSFRGENENQLIATLVLIDINDGGKVYYCSLANAYSGGNLIDLTRFTTGLNGSGDHFAPKNLDEIFGITVMAEGTYAGDYVARLVSCADVGGTATFTDKNGVGYRLATETELENNGITKYAVTDIDNFAEKYFLTIVTTAGTTFHRQVLTTQNSLISRTVPTARLISETENSEIIYLFLGKIFQQEDLSVTSRSSNNTAEMSATNNQLIVSMSVDIVFADEVTSDAQLLSRIRGILNGVELYHSYAVYLTRTVNNEKNRIIIGNPSTSGSYYRIDGGDAALYGGTIVIGEDEEEEIINLPPVNVNSNFAEFVTENLSGRFAGNSDAVEINISATITLTYSIEAIYRQFPQGSASEETDGVTVSATSNLAFSASSTSYSKNSEEKDDEEENIYYSTGEGETAMLYLGVVGDREGDYSPLGINPKTLGPDVTNYKFKLSGVLDISGIYSSVNDYDSISVSIELYQKTNGGYVSVASLDDYLNSVYVYLDDEHKIVYENDEITNDVLTADNNEVVLETTGSSPNILFYIDVNVITGAAFEANNNLYTNYQLVVSANVMKNGSTYGGISDASNFVIYTHAKVLSDFIRTN